MQTRDIAAVSLREMVAHLNVIEAAIDTLGAAVSSDRDARLRDVLRRFELLAFSAARLRIADLARVTDALEELVLALHVGRRHHDDDVAAALRHGVDVLMLLTHDKMRRLQGYPAAELRPSADAVIDRVDRVMGGAAPPAQPAVKLAGL